MGILNYYKWLKESYPDAFNKKYLETYDNIYIDLNYLLHMSSYNTESKKQVISKLYDFIENILSVCPPKKSVNFFTDGPCPLAKLILQRQRRITIAKDNEISNVKFSSLNFTAGTKFMDNIRDDLKLISKKIELIFNVKTNFYVDDNDEAEIKIKKQLMMNQKNNRNDSHLLVTNDADVVVILTTLTDPHSTFILFRDKEYKILSISNLLYHHTKKYGKGKYYNLDFALLSMFQGNDYLKKVGLVTLDNIWKAYKLNLNLQKDKALVINKNLDINNEFLSDILFDVCRLSNVKRKPHNDFVIENINIELYKNYLDGITWCLDLYSSGICKRYNYMYKYTESPNPFILAFIIKKKPELLKYKIGIFPPLKKELYIILLLPKSVKQLINSKYHDFMDKYPTLYDEKKPISSDVVKTIMNDFDKIFI
jgi:5'-3' exonuclease